MNFGWDLPPGCTHADIDTYRGDPNTCDICGVATRGNGRMRPNGMLVCIVCRACDEPTEEPWAPSPAAGTSAIAQAELGDEWPWPNF